MVAIDTAQPVSNTADATPSQAERRIRAAFAGAKEGEVVRVEITGRNGEVIKTTDPDSISQSTYASATRVLLFKSKFAVGDGEGGVKPDAFTATSFHVIAPPKRLEAPARVKFGPLDALRDPFPGNRSLRPTTKPGTVDDNNRLWENPAVVQAHLVAAGKFLGKSEKDMLGASLQDHRIGKDTLGGIKLFKESFALENASRGQVKNALATLAYDPSDDIASRPDNVSAKTANTYKEGRSALLKQLKAATTPDQRRTLLDDLVEADKTWKNLLSLGATLQGPFNDHPQKTTADFNAAEQKLLSAFRK